MVICQKAKNILNNDNIILSEKANNFLSDQSDKTQVGYVTNPLIERIIQQTKCNITYGLMYQDSDSYNKRNREIAR